MDCRGFAAAAVPSSRLAMHAALSVRPIEPVGPDPDVSGRRLFAAGGLDHSAPVSNVCNLPAEQIGRCCQKVARVPQRSGACPRPNHAVGRSTGPEDPHPVWEEFREDEHDLLSGPIRVKTHCPHFSVRAFRLEACLAEAFTDSQSLGGGHSLKHLAGVNLAFAGPSGAPSRS